MTTYSPLIHYQQQLNNQQKMKEFIKMFLTDDEGKEFTKKEVITTIACTIAMVALVIMASMFE